MTTFGGFGTLAYGDRFVGRREELEVIQRIVGSGLASRALVGLPRVGKSSLAKAFYDGLEQHDEVRCHWVDVGSLATDDSALSQVQSIISLEDESSHTVSSTGLKGLLRQRVRTGTRTVVVFDNFDSIRRVHQAAIDVRRLRELIADPATYGLTALLVCRRRLSDLEVQIPDVSNLANACSPLFLRPFDDTDLGQALQRSEAPPEDVSETIQQIIQISGGFPQLVEESLFYIYDLRSPRWKTLLHPARAAFLEELGNFLHAAGLLDDLGNVATQSGGVDPQAEEMLEYYGVVSDGQSPPRLLSNLLSDERLYARLEIASSR